MTTISLIKKNLTILLIIVCCFATSDAYAQDDFYKRYRNRLETKIPLKSILGNWITEDSLYKISFVEQASMVSIIPKSHMQAYSFQIQNDSMQMGGCAMNWPPFYVLIYQLDDRRLKIEKYNFGSDTVLSHIYIKE